MGGIVLGSNEQRRRPGVRQVQPAEGVHNSIHWYPKVFRLTAFKPHMSLSATVHILHYQRKETSEIRSLDISNVSSRQTSGYMNIKVYYFSNLSPEKYTLQHHLICLLLSFRRDLNITNCVMLRVSPKLETVVLSHLSPMFQKICQQLCKLCTKSPSLTMNSNIV